MFRQAKAPAILDEWRGLASPYVLRLPNFPAGGLMTSRYRVGRSCDQVAGAPSGHSPGFRLNGALPIKSKGWVVATGGEATLSSGKDAALIALRVCDAPS